MKLSRKNLQPVIDLLPEERQPNMSGMIGPLRHEVAGLRIKNENLRPLKSELARLRASMADLFWKASEKNIDDKPAPG